MLLLFYFLLTIREGVVYLWGMIRETTKKGLREELKMAGEGKRVLVPTMGALHAGHKALFMRAREIAGDAGKVVVSVFLNPTQFNQATDLQTYPRTPEQDIRLCKESGVDILFMPEIGEMYEAERSIVVRETELSRVLCGASRPGHFDGVCLVVSKLFNLVQPTDAVFGEKDYQQLAILRRLVRELDFPIVLHAVPIIRERDGLAVSSRNVRLSKEQREQAPRLYASLRAAVRAYTDRLTAEEVCEMARRELRTLPGVRIDYVQMVDAMNLQPVTGRYTEDRAAVLAAAVYFGDVRLIDNIQIPVHS